MRTRQFAFHMTAAIAFATTAGASELIAPTLSGAGASVGADVTVVLGQPAVGLTFASAHEARLGAAYCWDAAGGDCPGDLDGDAAVSIADLAVLLAHFGVTAGAAYEDGDLNGDGAVDISDLAQMLALFGTSCA